MIEVKEIEDNLTEYDRMAIKYAEVSAKYRVLRCLVERNIEDYDRGFFKVRKADILAALDGNPVKEEENGGVDKSTQGDYGESSLD